MKKWVLAAGLIIGALSLSACSKSADTGEAAKVSEETKAEDAASTVDDAAADVIYTNGYIYTENEDAMGYELYL